MDTRATTSTRLSLIPVVIALLMNLVIGPLAPFIQDGLTDVLGAPVSVPDEDGPNDEPGQKDLTKLTIDYGAPGATSIDVSWNWDEIDWPGGNTGDACALFDTNGNLMVDAAICVTVNDPDGDPEQAELYDVRLFECTADAKVDRCTGPVEVPGALTSTCTVDQTTTDPFPAGSEYPVDTTAECAILLAEVGATAADLVNVCSFPSEEPNSDPSDCVLIIRDGVLHVTKVVVNDNGGTKACADFTFQVNGGTAQAFEADCTSEVAVEPGSYSIVEPAVSGYTTTYENSLNSSLNCTSLEVPSFGDPSDIVTCTITNNDQPATLTVTKIVVNDNGGTKVIADFPLFVDLNAVTSGQANTVSAGQHTVSETGAAGYTATIGGDCAANGTVTLALGESKTCTITNDDNAPSLTLIKSLTNDNGGAAAATDWTLTATGPTGFSGTTPVSNGASFDAGTYDLSESGPADYTASSWVCVGGTQDDSDTITLALGESATCTITNDDDEASLTLIKEVTNDNGGTAVVADWTLTATGPTGFSGSSPASNGASFDAGTYDLSESGPSGYTASDWVCVGGDQTDANTVVIGLGEDVTCTITNDDDAPSLTLVKQVINNNGGTALATDWTLSASGPSGFSGTTPATNGASFDAGTYNLSESGGPSGYTASDWVCVGGDQTDGDTVAIGLGDDVTCTITNDDQAGTLIVEKVIVGGDATCDDFTFTVNAGAPNQFDADCSNQLTRDAGTYSVFEPLVSGWTTTYANDLNSDLDCTDLALGNGETVTCTITNTRDTGDVTIIKDLNPSGDPGLFDLMIDDDVILADAGDGDSTGPTTVDTGTYDIGEQAGTGTTLTDYASSISCVDDGGEGEEVASGLGTSVSLDVTKDSDIVCTITNTAVDVTIVKTNDVADGNVEPGDSVHFTLTVTVNIGQATDVVVTDEVPDGLTYTSGSADPSAGFTATGQDLKWIVGTLAAGTYTYEYDATVDADASGTLTNLGCVDADQNPDLVCDETDLDVQNIVVTKTNATTGAVVPGSSVNFTLTLDVTNGPIDEVTIVDQLPTGISNATAISDGGTYNAATNRITWNLTDVDDNEVLTYTATVSASATAGSYTNVATITEGPCVGDGCDDDSTVTVRVPTLVVDKVASTETITISGPATALVATPSVVTWTLSYTLASGPVTNAVITDVIPTGFTYVTGSASSGGVFTAGTNTLTWTFPTLSASGSVTFQTTVNPATISRTAPTVNTAAIDSNETAPDQGTDSVSVVVSPPPLAGNPPPTPKPVLPNTATGIGIGGEPVTVPVELLAAFFLGSLGAVALVNARARGRRR